MKLPLINAMLGYGYVEETSHGTLWITTHFKGTDQEFLDTLKGLFRDCYREMHTENIVLSKCCAKSKENIEFDHCPNCGKSLIDSTLAEEDIDEEIRDWFVQIVQGNFDSVGYDLTEWMEEHGVYFGFRSEFAGKSSILYDIGAFDMFLIHDPRMVNVTRYDTKISKGTEIKLERESNES